MRRLIRKTAASSGAILAELEASGVLHEAADALVCVGLQQGLGRGSVVTREWQVAGRSDVQALVRLFDKRAQLPR